MTEDPRRPVPSVAPEHAMVSAMLEYQQDTLPLKIAGLSDVQLRQALVPSGTTLLGIIKHQAYVHRWWFRYVFAGEEVMFPWSESDPDADWRIEPDDTTEQILALYQEEVGLSRTIIAAASFDDPARNSERGFTLRRIMLHMIQEIARHAGHIDILAELIDGRTGR